MSEFFMSLWSGIIANKDTIITIITSAEFAALAAMLVGIFKNNKTGKDNHLSNVSLSSNILTLSTTVQNLSTSLGDCITDINTAKTELIALKSASEESHEKENLILKKLDAILEVQRLVYSTLRDENTRSIVENIIVNAIHSETLEKVELKKQLNVLKAKVVESAHAIQEEVADAVHKAETIMHVTEDVTTPIERA